MRLVTNGWRQACLSMKGADAALFQVGVAQPEVFEIQIAPPGYHKRYDVSQYVQGLLEKAAHYLLGLDFVGESQLGLHWNAHEHIGEGREGAVGIGSYVGNLGLVLLGYPGNGDWHNRFSRTRPDEQQISLRDGWFIEISHTKGWYP